MGKILESMGVIDGYDIVAIGKIKVKKDKIFADIIKFDKKVKEEAREIVSSSSGKVFAITKKGIIKGIYLFKIENEDGDKNLTHIKTVYSSEVDKEVREKYDNHILNVAKDYVSMQEYHKVTLENKEVELDPKKTSKERQLAFAGGFAIGCLIGWMIMGEWYFGLLYGIIFAPLFSGLEVVITDKKGKKKEKNKKND